MTSYAKTLTVLSASALALTGTAHAHTGAHTADFITVVLHWLSSPLHIAMLLTGSAVVGFIAYKLARKNRA